LYSDIKPLYLNNAPIASNKLLFVFTIRGRFNKMKLDVVTSAHCYLNGDCIGVRVFALLKPSFKDITGQPGRNKKASHKKAKKLLS